MRIGSASTPRRAAAPTAAVRVRLVLGGAVQGVGLRPFAHRLARELALGGWVRNAGAGAEIEVEGDAGRCERFAQRLCGEAPLPARPALLERAWLDARGVSAFEIRASAPEAAGAAAPLDLASCEDCLREVRDPADRRHRYPFASCARCGPRYTILRCFPWDRAQTSMASFAPCAACRAEYADPDDRRFHAQTIACARCGPELRWTDREGRSEARGDAALRAGVAALREGAVVALQGLGGFQLLASARDAEAVARLRKRKQRPHRPLALLYPHLRALREDCEVGALEAELLTSSAAPIVLLRRRAAARIAEAVAPGVPRVGAMLPTTPLHALLADGFGAPLVATSGNLAGEPLCAAASEAYARLGAIADAFLVHDREIVRALDDSVAHVGAGRARLIRRARGYAPAPVCSVAGAPDGVVALGGHLKSAIAFTQAGCVHVGPHLGDLEDARAAERFDASLDALLALHGVRPRAALHDGHPGYHSARSAQRLGGDARPVQHHVAHLRGCALEQGVVGPALGVAWDGAGAGPDGTLWGGEFFALEARECVRLAHLRRFPLPGGEVALREPRRAALGVLYEMAGEQALSWLDLPAVAAFSCDERALLAGALRRCVNAPLTSSAGRLFDAAAALLGLCARASFEGQAALALEAAAESADPLRDDVGYPFELTDADSPWCIDWAPLVSAVLADLRGGSRAPRIAARFHATLVDVIERVALRAGFEHVVLSGGCFQNLRLLERAERRLRALGFTPHWPERVPANDGGLAFGQLAAVLAEEGSDVSRGAR